MSEPHPISFDAPLGQRIIELHVWAVRQGLLGTAASELFDGFCLGYQIGKRAGQPDLTVFAAFEL